MRIKYFIIIVLLAYLIASAIVACPSSEEIQRAREDREEEIRRGEISRQEEAYFKELTEYCREHEDMYMEISEQVFCYLDGGLSKDEARAAMENNATSEQKEILEKQPPLCYPSNKNDIVGYSTGTDKGLYYGCGNIKVVYIYEYSQEIEKKIMSVRFTTTEKINDHLYVCYRDIPYT